MDRFRNDAGGWSGFKKTWSIEDISTLGSVLKKVEVDANSRPGLRIPLTEQEKTWTANFVVQAFFWGCCRENASIQ